MEDEIAADLQLGCVIFRIKPGNRYDACICSKDKEEIIGHGPLDQLLGYLPNTKDQVHEESCGSFKLELPDDVDEKTWFTRATLTRFLHIISSPESLNKSIAISKEMSQLEETRKFHLSLYSKEEDGIMSSDNSKNELLRAMDSRLAALMEELVSTFTVAAGATFSYQVMTDLQNFFEHFGDEDVSNMLSKLSKTSQNGQSVVLPDNKRSSGPLVPNDEHVNKTCENVRSSASSNSVKPVIYNASPTKAAEIERQSSTESDDSSFSSEDNQPSVERSRTLVRSASPRRSASPMRRVQIGRSGPRRTPAITIKSLTCFPARERISFHRDTEEPEESNKKTEVNVTRMSVQDAISLFESKQRDQTSDTQKKSTVDCANANKSVLRRWSAGMGESQKFVTQNLSENTPSENNLDVVDKDALKNEDVKPEMNMTFENPEAEEIVRVVDIETDTIVKTESFLNEDDFPVSQTVKFNGKMDSVEWSRQKEVELSQMLMKFAEYKNAEPDSGKMQNTSLNQRRSSGAQKDKKDEKLRGENGGKKAQSEFRAKQKVLNQREAEKSSKKVTNAGKKLGANRSSTVNKNSPVPLSAKKESPKPSVPKRVPSKSTPLPATRKSWPSTPSPRATGALPGKIPTGTTSGTGASSQKPRTPALSQKPQSPAPLSRASPKFERLQLQQKDVKKAPVETKKSLKRVDDSKNNSVLPKSGRQTKTTLKTDGKTEKDVGTISPVKAVVRKNGTKKSSVVPLEVKPSITRKGSGTNPARNPSVQKIEIHTQVEETSIKCEDPIMSHEKADSINSDMAYQVEVTPLSETHNGVIGEEREPEVEKPKDAGEEETFDETPAQVDEISGRISESSAELQPTQELIISPSAWEESSQQDLPIPGGNSDAPSPLNHDVVASPEPRVRHSLSQMLLEETSEPDIIEWGNAENPPTMVYQKDAPKGLKRLLKFARKNKAEANGTAWSSPYTSEGEDDGDEAKSLGKRNSDNLLRKVALHSKNYGEGFLSDSEPLSARSNASNSSARSSNKFHEGHTTSKGTRFFSLSAFRSTKN